MASLTQWPVGTCGCNCGSVCILASPVAVTSNVGGYALASCCWCIDAQHPASINFDVSVYGSSSYPLVQGYGFIGPTPGFGLTWQTPCISTGVNTWIRFIFITGIMYPVLYHGSCNNADGSIGYNSVAGWLYFSTLYGSPPPLFNCDTSPPYASQVIGSLYYNGGNPLYGLGARLVTISWTNGNTGIGVTCVACNASCPNTIPSTLDITDALGTYTATWNSTLSLWITPQLCSLSSTSPTAKCTSGTGACNSGTHPAGALYTYSIGCTSSGHMTINRYWYELVCVSPSFQYSPCSCSPGGPQAYSSSGSVAVTCGSISWSGSLTKISGNLADPVGGSVSFTQ